MDGWISLPLLSLFICHWLHLRASRGSRYTSVAGRSRDIFRLPAPPVEEVARLIDSAEERMAVNTDTCQKLAAAAIHALNRMAGSISPRPRLGATLIQRETQQRIIRKVLRLYVRLVAISPPDGRVALAELVDDAVFLERPCL